MTVASLAILLYDQCASYVGTACLTASHTDSLVLTLDQEVREYRSLVQTFTLTRGRSHSYALVGPIGLGRYL